MNRKHIESLHKLKKVSLFFDNFQIEKGKEIYFSPTHTLYYLFPDYASVFLGERESHIHIYIHKDNYRFETSHYNIPIFPSWDKLLRAYIDLMDFFWWNLELIVYDDKLINSDEELINIWGISFLGIPYQIKHARRNIEFKLLHEWSANSEVEAMLVAVQWRSFIKYNISIKKNISLNSVIVESIFKYLDLHYGRNFKGLAWNKWKWKTIWIARVLHRHQLKYQNEWFNSFDKWDIVVAHSTDVFYMKYIFDSSGIITENNNLLSHASLISRELNLGLCLWIQNIFLKIFDWDTIEVDSDEGAVRVISRFWEQ